MLFCCWAFAVCPHLSVTYLLGPLPSIQGQCLFLTSLGSLLFQIVNFLGEVL